MKEGDYFIIELTEPSKIDKNKEENKDENMIKKEVVPR